MALHNNPVFFLFRKCGEYIEPDLALFKSLWDMQIYSAEVYQTIENLIPELNDGLLENGTGIDKEKHVLGIEEKRHHNACGSDDIESSDSEEVDPGEDSLLSDCEDEADNPCPDS